MYFTMLDIIIHMIYVYFRIHNEGIGLDLKSLYPRIAYPVGRGTPMISPMLKWDHSIEWQVPLFAKVYVILVYSMFF